MCFVSRMIRLGVAQISNHFDYSLNLNGILSAMETGARNGVELLVLPECAITGYNTGLLNIDGAKIESSIRAIQECAKKHQLPLLLPTPTPAGDSKFHNSVLFIDENGVCQEVFHKVGLQRGEERLFVPGTNEKSYYDFRGIRIGLVICIEAAHEPWTYIKEADGVQLLVWPGFWSWDEGREDGDLYSEWNRNALRNVQTWPFPVIQVTCANSPESHLWPDKRLGGSRVFDREGQVVYQAKVEAEDFLVVEVAPGLQLQVESRS